MADWVSMAEGVQRRIRADGDKLMLVEVQFVAGASVATHHHPHEQVTYIVSGRLRFTLDGQTTILSAGQSIFIPSNVPHSVTAEEATTLLDAFSPPREDFR